MINVDNLIIGAGPTGLTIAYYLIQQKKSVIIIDSNPIAGGCHRMNLISSPNNPFISVSEHGPRLYNDNMVNFIDMLKKFGLPEFSNSQSCFVKYKYNIFSLSLPLSAKTFALLTKDYLLYMFSANRKESMMNQLVDSILFPFTSEGSITIADWCKQNNIDDKSTELLDRLCRTMDGADSTRFSLYELFHILDQNLLATLYTQKYSFAYEWQKYLANRGVQFIMNTEFDPTKYSYSSLINNEKLHLYTVNDTQIQAKKLIFAIPPKPYYDIAIAINSKVPTKQWIDQHSYNNYITINFYSKTKYIQNTYGFSNANLGVNYMFISDYLNIPLDIKQSLQLQYNTYPTIITASISKPENITTSDLDVLAKEIWNEILLLQPNISYDSHKYTDDIYVDNIGRVLAKDTAYFMFIDGNNTFYNSDVGNNIYWVGTQNGNHNYGFTSVKTAVSNAKSFMGEPVLQSSEFSSDLMVFLLIFMIIILIALIAKKYHYIKKRRIYI